MPRVADHDARRALLAGAVLDIALEQGLERVSVQRIAQAAGTSVGLVQHYFPAKSALVVVAYEELARTVDGRIAMLVQEGEAQGRPIRELVAEALAQLLPLDAAHAAQARVRAEFAARALREPELAAVAHGLHDALARRLVAAVENGRLCGETDPDVEATEAAVELLALAEGHAASQLLAGAAGQSGGVERARAALSTACGRIFPGQCRRSTATTHTTV